MRLVDSYQMQEMDRYTIEEVGVDGIVLMENAARSWISAADIVLRSAENILIFCGAGNNGGDGYAIARSLANYGLSCQVIAVKPPKSQDCKKNAQIWKFYGKTLNWDQFNEKKSIVTDQTILIDAILGTGIEDEIRGVLIDIIKEIDQLPGIKMAVDLPSGISATTGDRLGVGIRANYTITFQKEKVGHHLNPGKEYTGQLICQKISIIEKYPEGGQYYDLITESRVKPLLPKRRADVYKNLLGHVVTWCGASGTLGASLLASYSALKAGAGLVTAALPINQQTAFLSAAPEVMSFPQKHISSTWLKKFDAVVVGCGLGRESETWKYIGEIIQEANIPTVLDADAFYGIKDLKSLDLEHLVLTPHPGEFEQLSGFSKPKNNRERIEQGLAFVKDFPTTLVLKGAPTIIFDCNSNIYINGSGNPGMATAGSGDVLAGIIGSFLAQGLSTIDSSLLATWLHGKSGDIYRDQFEEESLTASCLIDNLRNSIRYLKDFS